MCNIGNPSPRGENFDRSPRRLRQAARIAKGGGRVVVECLIDVASGRDLDETLEDFARLDPATYHAVIYRFAAMADDEAVS